MKAEVLDDGFAQPAMPVGVLALGFEASELERLKRMLQRPVGPRHYALVSEGSPYEVLLVNYDSPAARRDQDRFLHTRPHRVAVSRAALDGAPEHHIRGMLIASKVLGLLDSLPRRVATPSPAATCLHAPIPKIVAPEVEPLAGYRALVVDDSLAIQKSLETHLATLPQIGKVEFADDGHSALQMAQATRYDLIFLDVMMPGLDGYDTCTRLRKLPEYKKTPIIMVSAKTSPLDEVKGVIAGCTTYLTKPVQADAFHKLGQRVIGWLDHYRHNSPA